MLNCLIKLLLLHIDLWYHLFLFRTLFLYLKIQTAAKIWYAGLHINTTSLDMANFIQSALLKVCLKIRVFIATTNFENTIPRQCECSFADF